MAASSRGLSLGLGNALSQGLGPGLLRFAAPSSLCARCLSARPQPSRSALGPSTRWSSTESGPGATAATTPSPLSPPPPHSTVAGVFASPSGEVSTSPALEISSPTTTTHHPPLPPPPNAIIDANDHDHPDDVNDEYDVDDHAYDTDAVAAHDLNSETAAYFDVTGIPRPPYRIRAGVILTRPPLLTRPLHPFEESFFFYQKRLNERLTLPFVSNVYYKPNTPAHMDWQAKLKERKGILGRELGGYRGRGAADAWDDELLVGDPLPRQEHVVDVLLRDSVMRFSEDGELIPEEDRAEPERPLPRETDADRCGDLCRLDRKLDRTLYLLVRDQKGDWGFPDDLVLRREGLHNTAHRIMRETAGVNMNTWLVSRVPVAHLVTKPVFSPDGGLVEEGSKTFFLKARIMAGQANLKDNPLGYTDFKWLAREEVEAALTPEYFKGVRNMMASR